MRPTVSIIIPTRNRASLVARTLRTALAQRNAQFEVIVIDEASEDETPALLANLHDERVRVLRNERPEGVARARNRGIEAANGEYVAFLDDDDIWAPDKLERQLDAMAKTGRPWCYGSVVLVDETYAPLLAMRADDMHDFDRRILETYLVPAGSSNVVARTSLVRDLNGFDDAFVHNADWDMWIRLGQVDAPAVVHEFVLAYVRHQRMVSRVAAGKYEDLALLRQKHSDARARSGASSNEAESLAWIGTSSLWAGDRKAARRAFRQAARLDPSVKALARAALVGLPGYLGVLDAYQRWRLPPEVASTDRWLGPFRDELANEKGAAP